MSTLTKKWLQQTIAELEEERDAVPGVVNEDAAMSLAAMKLALASLEAEPVSVNDDMAYAFHHAISDSSLGSDEVEEIKAGLRAAFANVTAPPAPVVDADDNFYSWFGREWHEHYQQNQYTTAAKQMLGFMAESAWKAGRRAAMLQGADGTLTNEGTMPVNQFKPVADLYGLTSPTGGETSFTFDAVEARDFIDGGWSCQEYVELGRFQEAMLQNGNSPAQSDCCPEQNYIAPAQDGDSPVIPDGWIPVSERMPGSQEWVIVFAKWDNQQVLCWDDVANRWTDFEDQSYYADMFTHWMPLPAAPQQEVESQIRKGKTVAREEWELGARLTKHRFKP
ncbi:DUF551 domain-containing protein [Enterobacter intestinihominis]|nr:DUF551 domain-containing protein [Enterobacter hormaechei]